MFFFKYVYSMSRTSQNKNKTKHMFKTHILICINWVLNLDYFRYCFLPLFQEGNVGTFILPRKKNCHGAIFRKLVCPSEFGSFERWDARTSSKFSWSLKWLFSRRVIRHNMAIKIFCEIAYIGQLG